MAREKNIQGLFTLVASRNKNTKKIENLKIKDEGYSRSHKKVKPVKGSFPRNFSKFKAAA